MQENRWKYVTFLKSAGLSAEGFGKGWNSGMFDFDKMLEIFFNSKINLNFVKSLPCHVERVLKFLVKMLVIKENNHYHFNFDPLGQLEFVAGVQRRQIKKVYI